MIFARAFGFAFLVSIMLFFFSLVVGVVNFFVILSPYIFILVVVPLYALFRIVVEVSTIITNLILGKKEC